MSVLSICTTRERPEDLSYENFRLYQEGLGLYDKVYLINPNKVIYKFFRESSVPNLILNNEILNYIDTLILRGTKGREVSTIFLAHVLSMLGCNIIDPL